MNNFLKTALDKLFTYTTPKPVVKYIETNFLIQNPPFKAKKHENRNKRLLEWHRTNLRR